MAGYVYKPQTRKGPVFLAPDNAGTPTITLPDGRVIEGVRGDQRGGVFYGHEGYQWVFDNDILGQEGAVLRYGGKEQTLGNTNMSYRGGEFGNLAESGKGAVGDVGATGGGSVYNGYGVAPEYIGNLFPDPKLAKTAPYEFTDPMKFAEAFGEFNRGEMVKNYQFSKDIALDTLDTELAALRGFIPAASALKRGETSLDNMFNQYERTRQIDSTLPSARGDLEGQRQRASTLAEGRLPSSIEDRAFEVSSRSAAADMASAGGFGPQSSAARKASDLMSAERRLQVSQYGDQLLSSNLTQSANLLLAPTQYSNAGAQINVNPSVSPAALINQEFNRTNEQTLVRPETALQTTVQQNQFTTGLEQQTRLFNTTNQNNFALSRFNYEAAYASAVAGAQQIGINTQVALEQQQQYQEIFSKYLNQAQSAGQTSAIAGLISSLFGSGAVEGIIGAISEFFNGGDSGQEGGTSSPRTPPIAGPGQISVPSNEPAPEGYTPVGTGSDGSTIYAPNEVAQPQTQSPVSEPAPGQEDIRPPEQPPESWTVDDDGVYTTQAARVPPQTQAQLKNFSASTGVPISVMGNKSPAQLQGLTKAASGTLQASGISNSPGPGMVAAGSDTNGNPIYISQALAASNNPTAGSKTAKSLAEVLNPFGILSDEDVSTIDRIGAAASDVAFLDRLNTLRQNGNTKDFTNAILQRFGYPIAQSLTDNVDNQNGIAAAFNAYNMYNYWDRMSTTQKSLGLANLGIQSFKFATGEDLGAKKIFDAVYSSDGTLSSPELTVGTALDLLGAGYNVYNLVDNWNEYSTIQKVTGGVTTAAQVAGVAKELGLLKAGTPGLETLGQVAGVAGIALGAKTVIDGWGEGGGAKGAVRGGLGGASIVSGLSMLGYSNPYTAAAIIATSVLGNTIQVGKSKDQGGRDSIRSHFKEMGLVDGDYKVALPDGSIANLGIDGHGGQHDATNPDLIDRKQKKLNAWDLDYTNDLDYVSGMAGIGLARMLGGGSNKPVDQLGNQIGNAGLGSVGFNQKMTRENFDTVMQNQRALYAKSGINSKADAYALSVELLKQGRISQTDAVQIQQAANMMYDQNGYDTAQRLMNGRQRGAEVAADGLPKPKPAAGVNLETTGRTKLDPRNIPGADKARNIPTVKGTSGKPADGKQVRREDISLNELYKAPMSNKPKIDKNTFKFLGKAEVVERNRNRGVNGWRANS